MIRQKIIKLCGWIGAMCFAFCGLPQAIQVVQQGHAEGVSPYFIGLWFAGEILSMIYVYFTHGLDKPLFTNYVLNLAFISVILYYLI